MPKPVEDAVLGRFTWDRDNEYWLGAVDVAPGVSTWLTIQVGPSEGAAVLALAREAVARVKELDPEARRFLADQLWKDRRPGAHKGGRKGIDHAVGLLVLRSISAEAEGVLDLVYGGEEVFGGVQFLVWFDREGGRGVIAMHEDPPSDEGQAAGSPD